MIEIKTELKPFQVPNYVIAVSKPRPRQEGIVEAPKYALSELDERILDQLCTQFRRDVFAKAGKADPKG